MRKSLSALLALFLILTLVLAGCGGKELSLADATQKADFFFEVLST